MEAEIDISLPSDIAPLREVVVGVVKAFSWESLAAESDPSDDREATRALVRHNRVEIPDAGRSLVEHRAFVDLLESRGVVVHHTVPIDGISVQLYPRDLGVAIDDTLFLARSRVGVRRKEREGVAHVLDRVGRVVELDSGRLEGGDVIVTATEVLVGLGEETDLDGIRALRRALAAAGNEREVVPLGFSSRGVVHLDTKFTLVGDGLGLIQREAFLPDALAALEERFDLIDATHDEARDLQVNTLALDPATVIVRESGTRIADQLRARGITPIPISFAEIARFPGAYRCATLPLRRG